MLHDGSGVLRGSEKVALELMEGMSDHRWAVLTCHEAFANAAARLPNVREVHLKPVRAVLGGSLGLGEWAVLLRQARLVARLVKQTRANLIHVNNATFSNWAVLAGWWCGIPVIAHVHSPLSRRTRLRLGVHAADRIVGVSRAILAPSLSVKSVAARCRVIYNGQAAAPAAPGNRQSARAALRLEEHDVVLGVVGVLLPGKRVDVAIKALRHLEGKLRDRAVLLVVGDGFARAELEHQAAGLRVRFLGQRDDVSALLAHVIDILLMPSEMEAFSMVLLEAGAAGLPRIASTVGGNAESIQDGIDGLLVEPGEPLALASAIAAIVSNPEFAARLGAAGAARVQTEFTQDRFLTAMAMLYREVQGDLPSRWTRLTSAAYQVFDRHRTPLSAGTRSHS